MVDLTLQSIAEFFRDGPRPRKRRALKQLDVIAHAVERGWARANALPTTADDLGPDARRVYFRYCHLVLRRPGITATDVAGDEVAGGDEDVIRGERVSIGLLQCPGSYRLPAAGLRALASLAVSAALIDAAGCEVAMTHRTLSLVVAPDDLLPFVASARDLIEEHCVEDRKAAVA